MLLGRGLKNAALQKGICDSVVHCRTQVGWYILYTIFIFYFYLGMICFIGYYILFDRSILTLMCSFDLIGLNLTDLYLVDTLTWHGWLLLGWTWPGWLFGLADFDLVSLKLVDVSLFILTWLTLIGLTLTLVGPDWPWHGWPWLIPGWTWLAVTWLTLTSLTLTWLILIIVWLTLTWPN